MAKAKENVSNVEIYIISLESVQNYQETTIKEPSLVDHEVIATKDEKGQRTKIIESARETPKAHLPYGMFLTRLFQHVMELYPHLDNGIYDVVERVMRLLALRQTRRPRRDDDEDDGASRASTPSPTTYLNSLKPLDYQQYEVSTSSEQNDDLLFERQTDLLNQTQQMHKELKGGFKLFGKALRGVFSKKKNCKKIEVKFSVPGRGLTVLDSGLHDSLESGKPLRANMANENVPAPAPTRSDEHILPFVLDEHRFTLDTNLLREALEIIPIDQAYQFVSPPSGDAIMDFVNELGYIEEIHFMSRMAVNNLYKPWRAILSMINQCLTGRTHNIHQRLASLFHLAEEDHRHGNLKFVPKGEDDEVFGMPIPNELITNNIRNAPYYNAYLEMVAKHDQKIAAKKGGKKKPATAKQLKLKPIKKKSSKLALAPKPKSSLQPIDEDEPTQPEPEPKPEHQGEGEEYDVERAIQMSLESFQAQGQAHVGNVAIRELVAYATRPLHVVEGKGKEIATEEQAAQSLLALHTPKRRSTTDQFKFQRQIPSTKEAST
ncbi:hypothetical protein Tco_1385944 [Tanacetum coccineum]